MWGYAGPQQDVPVLYMLVHWIDDEFTLLTPEEGGAWNNTDVFQFWLCESCVTQALTPAQALGPGFDWLCIHCDTDESTQPGLSYFRQGNVFLKDASSSNGSSGVRVWGPGVEGWPHNSDMPYTVARFNRVSDTEGYIELQWELFARYPDQYLDIVPNATTLPLGIAGFNDYDVSDRSFNVNAWGSSERYGTLADLFSDVVLTSALKTAVSPASWGRIKRQTR